MDAIEAIRSRRSVRHYRRESVARELIEAIIADAAHAPWTPTSAPEPWVFTVVEGHERIAALGERALAYARQNRPQRRGYEWLDRPDFSVFHGAPILVLISGRSDSRLALEECTRAGQILTLSAHARGLGCCWVGSPNLWLGDPLVQQELCIAAGFEPHAAFALGHPASIPPAPPPLRVRTTWL